MSDPVTARFRMQAFSSTPGIWANMEDGAAGKVWRPRQTAEDAIRKCVEWTGRIGIPAMQVVDLETGEVVWRDSRRYPQAGETVPASRRAFDKATSAAIDPASVEVGAERNLMHHPLGPHGDPLCEEPGCRRESIGPYSYRCTSHWHDFDQDDTWPTESAAAAWTPTGPTPEGLWQTTIFDERTASPRRAAAESRPKLRHPPTPAARP